MPKGVYTRVPGLRDPASHLAKLLGEPLPLSPLNPPGAAEEISLLLDQLEDLARPKTYSIYSTDFYRFLMERVWTRDEARGGRVARLPEYPFLRDLANDMVVEPKLFIEKSRRVLATWTACAFDVWIAAGGQDPRWPTLMNARGNRQVFLCHRKFQDADKCLQSRTWFIIQQLEERGIREVWPDFPRFSIKEGEIRGDNGSYVTAVPQGEDQLRGPGATLVHFEEVAFMEQAKATIEAGIPTVRGGGHLLAITTANAASYAKLIRDGDLRAGW